MELSLGCSLFGCVTLGKSLGLSEPWCPCHKASVSTRASTCIRGTATFDGLPVCLAVPAEER